MTSNGRWSGPPPSPTRSRCWWIQLFFCHCHTTILSFKKKTKCHLHPPKWFDFVNFSQILIDIFLSVFKSVAVHQNHFSISLQDPPPAFVLQSLWSLVSCLFLQLAAPPTDTGFLRTSPLFEPAPLSGHTPVSFFFIFVLEAISVYFYLKRSAIFRGFEMFIVYFSATLSPQISAARKSTPEEISGFGLEEFSEVVLNILRHWIATQGVDRF